MAIVIALAVKTTNVALSGLSTVADGVNLDTDGQKIHLVGQTTKSQNGVWVVHSSAWTRPTDFASGSQQGGAVVSVTDGTLLHDTGWRVTTASAIVDTDALNWFFATASALPAPTGNTTAFLRADGTWQVPAGGGGGGLVLTVTGASVNNADPLNPVVNAPTTAAVLATAQAEAAAAVVTHVALGDPHTQYLTAAEGNAAYAALIHATRHQAGGADSIKLDDLTAPDDNTDLNASTGAHGLMQKYPGGTANFLRADGAFAAPAGGGGGATLTAVTATVPTYGGQYAEVVVTDAAVSPSSKIMVVWGNVTDADQNTPDMDGVAFSAVPGTGQMTVRISATSPLDRIGGPYKLLTMVVT